MSFICNVFECLRHYHPSQARNALLMTPFAPWERREGTPGKMIDSVLAKLGLGRDFSHPDREESKTVT